MYGIQSSDGEYLSSLMQQQRLVAEGSNVCPLLSSVFIYPFILIIWVYLSSLQSLSCCFSSLFLHIHLTFSSVCKIIMATIITDYAEGTGACAPVGVHLNTHLHKAAFY